MANNHKGFQRVQRVLTVAPIVPGLASLAVASGQEGQALSPACFVVSIVVRIAGQLLTDLAPAIWQAFQGYWFGSHWVSVCPVKLVGVVVDFLRFLLGAA
jgi:hypothetical protein